ncbi:MAG: NFACT family protein [Candidatus Altiarchaeota archaeon]|nr:NFACT family protein [Candidatus Altiarchaeota archaeon]
MKSQLSSIDVRVLSKELQEGLNSTRVDKIYQISKRELKIKLHRAGHGSLDLIVAPTFMCLTRYSRPAPKDASSFAMQLRKHLSGGFIRGVKQHGFDRILEFMIENKGREYVLVVELFSKGNVILVDSDKKIIGLLDWQKWKHRKLGVGQVYEYPPEGVDAAAIDAGEFNEILSGSEKGIAATLATGLGLGGLYAEELCMNSKIDKDKISKTLDEKEKGILFESLRKLLDRELSPVVVLKDEEMTDIIPFELETYRGFEQKKLESFNDAVDEYFSKQEFEEKEGKAESGFEEKLKRLKEIEQGQRKSLDQLGGKSEEYRRVGDLIYQNLQDVDSAAGRVKKKEITAGDRIGKVRIESMNKDGTISVELE